MPQKQRSILGAVFVTAFLDLVGFSIIFPIFPQMLDYYLSAEGPDSLVGWLVQRLQAVAADSDRVDFTVVVLFGGVLGSSYSLLQFLFAPVWGAVSDRIGRRPTLVITVTGTLLAYLAWAFSGRFAALLASRFLAGLMAGNLATISAAVADSTSPSDRSKGMGVVGMGIGLGFIVGPALGGLCAGLDLRSLWPRGEQFGLNPFSAAALVAAALAALNLFLVLKRFPETLPARAPRLPLASDADVDGGGTAAKGRLGSGVRRGAVHRTANPLRLLRGIRLPGVQRATLISFLYLTGFSAMEFSLMFLAVDRFAYQPRDNAVLFVYVGLIIAAVQGGLIRRLSARVSDQALATFGLGCLIPGYFLLGLAPTPFVMFAGLGFLALGSGMVTPCLGALASRYAPSEQQGMALGFFRSAGAMSRAIGPVAGGILYWRLGSEAPFLFGALLALLPMAIALRLPKTP